MGGKSFFLYAFSVSKLLGNCRTILANLMFQSFLETLRDDTDSIESALTIGDNLLFRADDDFSPVNLPGIPNSKLFGTMPIATPICEQLLLLHCAEKGKFWAQNIRMC